MSKIVSEAHSGIPSEGLTVSLDADGGITVKSAAGVVFSIIDRSTPGTDFVSVEVYPYRITQDELLVEAIPAEYLRNPRTKVTHYSVTKVGGRP